MISEDANLQKQIEENRRLQDQYDVLHQNYDILQKNYSEMVKRLAKIENHLPMSDDDKNLPAGSEEAVSDTLIKNEISTMKSDAMNASLSITQLQNLWSYVDNTLESYNDRLENILQYMKRDSLIIKGLKDIPQKTYGLEFSKYVLGKLKELLPTIADKINIGDISVAHPLPTKNKTNPVVIVKFTRRDIKNLVFFEKRELKNSSPKVSLAEHLTKRNLWLMGEARNMVGWKNVWSSQCTVFALVNGQKVAIKNNKDLNYLFQQSEKNKRSSFASVVSSSQGPPQPSTTVHNQSAVHHDPRNTNTDSILNTLSNPDSLVKNN